MTLRLNTLKKDDLVQLCRPISGYPMGTVGTVVEVLESTDSEGRRISAVLVEWQSKRVGPSVKPTRKEFTQAQQERYRFLEKADDPQVPFFFVCSGYCDKKFPSDTPWDLQPNWYYGPKGGTKDNFLLCNLCKQEEARLRGITEEDQGLSKQRWRKDWNKFRIQNREKDRAD